MRRYIVALMAIYTTAMAAQAQSLESFKDSLASPTADGARVTVTESTEARAALDRLAQRPRKNKFLGYRIGIFFDNSPAARANAEAVCEEFRENFPTQSIYMIYENPYFKVSAGDCVTQEEAVVLLNRIQRVFPKAYIMREEMEANNIIIKPDSATQADSIDNLLLLLED